MDYIFPIEAVDATVHEKADHELNATERMHLMNTSLNQQILYESLQGLMAQGASQSSMIALRDDQRVTLNEYVFQDIELMADHYGNANKSIFSVLNQTQTMMGKQILKEMLLNPVHDIALLQKRQSLTRQFQAHRGALLPYFQKMKGLEEKMLWFYNEENMHHIDMLGDHIYFNFDILPFLDVNGILNSNETALNLTNIYKIFIAPSITILTPLMTIIVPIVLLFWFQRKTGIKFSWSMIWGVLKNMLFGNASLSLLFQNPSRAMLANIATRGLYLFLYIQNIYYSIQSAKNTNKIINMIHERLNDMSAYVKNAHAVVDTCRKRGINCYDSVITMTLDRCDAYVKTYHQLFDHGIFEKEPSIYNQKGKILYTYRYFNQIKGDFVNLFHFLGMCDALASIGFVVEGGVSAQPYTYVTYEEGAPAPKVTTREIWHPYLIKGSVLNDIGLEGKHVLITGPNAGGKSTFIKAMIVNILLAQTVGVACASSFEITPFQMIETYLQIPDAKGSASLFEAEMFRCKSYIEKLKGMPENAFSFIVLDEIFSSTNYVEGFSGAYAILKKVASFANTMSITTTHYSDLEYLEKDTQGAVVNYMVQIQRDPENNILFDYKVVPGVSREYIALELLQKNGFDEDLIETAMAIRNRVTRKFFDNLEETEVAVEEVAVEEAPLVVEEVVVEEAPLVVEEVAVEEAPLVVEEVVVEEKEMPEVGKVEEKKGKKKRGKKSV